VTVAVTTPWGLLRHWWVIVKLIATCAAVVLSLFALPAMTSIAYRDTIHGNLVATADAGTRLIIAGSVSVTLYLSLTAISVFKPWGRATVRRGPSTRSTAPTRTAPLIEEIPA
jgi:hypothetical protein